MILFRSLFQKGLPTDSSQLSNDFFLNMKKEKKNKNDFLPVMPRIRLYRGSAYENCNIPSVTENITMEVP